MEDRYILATDTFDNKVFTVCVFDRKKEQYVVFDSISGEKEFEKKVEELSKKYNTFPIKECVEKQPSSVNRIYAKIPRMDKAIIHYFKNEGKENLSKWLHENDCIDYMLIEQMRIFAEENRNKRYEK